jgi:hypothetical protein
MGRDPPVGYPVEERDDRKGRPCRHRPSRPDVARAPRPEAPPAPADEEERSTKAHPTARARGSPHERQMLRTSCSASPGSLTTWVGRSLTRWSSAITRFGGPEVLDISTCRSRRPAPVSSSTTSPPPASTTPTPITRSPETKVPAAGYADEKPPVVRIRVGSCTRCAHGTPGLSIQPPKPALPGRRTRCRREESRGTPHLGWRDDGATITPPAGRRDARRTSRARPRMTPRSRRLCRRRSAHRRP